MPSTGLRRRADLSGVFRISDRSVLVISADAARPVKEGVRAVGIDVDLDPRLDEVGPHRAFGDLQFQRPVGDAIVLADLTLLLHAQDLVEIDAGNGREGRAFAGRIDSETSVVGGQVDLADEGVGGLDRRDPGKPELFDQAILKRPERALRTPPRLGRIGPDVLDPELSSARPTWVGGRGRSRRPWQCGNSGCPGRYRGSSAGRARRTLPSAPGKSRPCLPPRQERPNRSLPWRHPASRSGRAAPRPRAIHVASHPDAASCPAAGAARASCRWAPLRGAFGTTPAHCRCSLSQV